MVAHALHYDGVLVQVTRVLGGNAGVYDIVEHRLYHQNMGCCCVTIITALTVMEKVEVKVEGQGDNGNGNAKGKGEKKRVAATIIIDYWVEDMYPII